MMVEELIDILRQSERQLTRDVQTIINSKLQSLLEQKKSTEMSLSHLKDCKEFVDKISREAVLNKFSHQRSI